LELEALEDRTLPSIIVNGNISVPGLTDTYNFNMPAAGNIYFDSLTNVSNLDWTLTGPPGTVVSQRPFSTSDSIDISNPVLNLVAGNYTIAVSGVGNATGPFSFRLRNLADAVPITPGTPVIGDFSPANETDFFSFNATAGDQYLFHPSARSGAPQARWRVVDMFGNTLAERDFSGTSSDIGPLTLTQTGTYTVLVEGRSSDTTVLLPIMLAA
jgi:hypothetical protein